MDGRKEDCWQWALSYLFQRWFEMWCQPLHSQWFLALLKKKTRYCSSTSTVIHSISHSVKWMLMFCMSLKHAGDAQQRRCLCLWFRVSSVATVLNSLPLSLCWLTDAWRLWGDFVSGLKLLLTVCPQISGGLHGLVFLLNSKLQMFESLIHAQKCSHTMHLNFPSGINLVIQYLSIYVLR